MPREAVTTELELIRKQHRGLLRPGDVVEYARDETTALHGQFEWNDTKCGQEYRLWQARELIQVHVTVLHELTDPVRAYVSLRDDRKRPGGGYRALVNVLRSPTLREALLRDALADLERLREKYRVLKELAPLFAAMDKIKSKRTDEAA